MHILYNYKHLDERFQISHINQSFQIHHNKAPKLNFEIPTSTTKSKSKLFSLNKEVKFLDLKSVYPNRALGGIWNFGSSIQWGFMEGNEK